MPAIEVRGLKKKQMIGRWLPLAGVVLLGAFAFVCLGYFISGLAKTQESITGAIQFINFPMMFLSGLFFPVDTMPHWIRPVVDAMPLTYLADALRQIMIGGTPLHPFGLDLLVMVVWLGVCAFLAVKFFRWELKKEGYLPDLLGVKTLRVRLWEAMPI